MLSDFNRRTRRHSESETERVNQSKSKTRSVVVVFTVHYSQNFDFKLVLLLQYTHEFVIRSVLELSGTAEWIEDNSLGGAGVGPSTLAASLVRALRPRADTAACQRHWAESRASWPGASGAPTCPASWAGLTCPASCPSVPQSRQHTADTAGLPSSSAAANPPGTARPPRTGHHGDGRRWGRLLHRHDVARWLRLRLRRHEGLSDAPRRVAWLCLVAAGERVDAARAQQKAGQDADNDARDGAAGDAVAIVLRSRCSQTSVSQHTISYTDMPLQSAHKGRAVLRVSAQIASLR
eukprot:1415436-Rhodomonas_salina.2